MKTYQAKAVLLEKLKNVAVEEVQRIYMVICILENSNSNPNDFNQCMWFRLKMFIVVLETLFDFLKGKTYRPTSSCKGKHRLHPSTWRCSIN